MVKRRLTEFEIAKIAADLQASNNRKFNGDIEVIVEPETDEEGEPIVTVHKKKSPMPTGPKGQKRPADVIGNAIRVAKIATGEIEEDAPADDGKDKAAQALGKKGGAARAKKLSSEERKEIAKKAAAARWREE